VIDSHCHLDACEPPVAELVGRARAAGVTRMATVGTDGASIRHALAAAEDHDEVVAIVGRHPHETAGFDELALEEIERRPPPARPRDRRDGLDYYRDHAPRRPAPRVRGPARARGARGAAGGDPHPRGRGRHVRAAREHAGSLPAVSCTASRRPDGSDECVERGYVCSFAGNVTYPKATELQERGARAARRAAARGDRLPVPAPQPVRGKPNEPANVAHTARYVAELRGSTYEELERRSSANAERVFGP
jgi:TatD DNase family protein